MSLPTPQEKRIWNTNKGDILVARKTMRGDNYPFGEVQIFTESKAYPVLEVLPIYPCVIILDDQGHRNKIDGDFITNFECRKATQ